MELSDKVVWITGASSGIGRALAAEMAGAGARLILTARRETLLEELRRELNVPQENVSLLPADVSKLESLESLAKRATGRFGTIDILVNNAGISQRATAAETDPSVMRRIIDLDFFAPALLSKYLLPVLAGRPESMIVVISSVTGKFGTQLRSSYAAAKHALHGYFESLRLEAWREKVLIQLVVAGFIRTEVSMNALKADGATNGVMDRAQLSGIPPRKAARGIVRAIRRNRREVKIGVDFRLRFALMLHALWPTMLFRLLRNARVT